MRIRHENPYRGEVRNYDLEPCGLLFDRDRWYLYGWEVDLQAERFLRADRVRHAEVSGMAFRPRLDLSVQSQIGRAWLSRAMRRWEGEGVVSEIRVSREQAERLARDWYYRHAAFAPDPQGGLLLRIANREPEVILPLVRWLGPGAELLSPPDLRVRLSRELAQMAREAGSADDI